MPTNTPRADLLHDVAVLLWSHTGVAACFMVQCLVPEGLHWFVRGCLFYVSMVATFKVVYEAALAVLRPGKIILPGHSERQHVDSHFVNKSEMIKGFIFAMLLRGATFAWVPDTFRGISSSDLHGGAVLAFASWWIMSMVCVFLWTIIYDFFYYWVHRFFHVNKWVFKWVHGKHHAIAQPFRGATLVHTTSEMLAEILLPTYLAQMFLTLSFPQLIIAYVNVQIMEVLGHSGTAWHTSSWSYCPALARHLGIGLRIEDHDAHHAERMVNFSKQFCLWDKVFGTYQAGHKARPTFQQQSSCTPRRCQPVGRLAPCARANSGHSLTCATPRNTRCAGGKQLAVVWPTLI